MSMHKTSLDKAILLDTQRMHNIMKSFPKLLPKYHSYALANKNAKLIGQHIEIATVYSAIYPRKPRGTWWPSGRVSS